MIEINVPSSEAFNEKTNEFVPLKAYTLSLEHSLVSISKWEANWKKPFLHSQKTPEEMLDYIKCMTISQNIPNEVYYRIPASEVDRIAKYIDDSMTATTFSRIGDQKPHRHEIVTAEVIYYWMIQANVPYECRKWHLNQLLTLLQVCAEKNKPPKKQSKKALADHWSALNAARRAKLHTKG